MIIFVVIHNHWCQIHKNKGGFFLQEGIMLHSLYKNHVLQILWITITDIDNILLSEIQSWNIQLQNALNLIIKSIAIFYPKVAVDLRKD